VQVFNEIDGLLDPMPDLLAPAGDIPETQAGA
jgi:hypothetical protein